jgi:hypothetical protein
MKINFDDPPEWLTCGCYRCVSLRVSICGSPLVSVCNRCGEVLAGKKDGLPATLEDCPKCEEK